MSCKTEAGSSTRSCKRASARPHLLSRKSRLPGQPCPTRTSLAVLSSSVKQLQSTSSDFKSRQAAASGFKQFNPLQVAASNFKQPA
eukprot:599156-Alexandrium_andersonii.AAC.1